MTGDRIRFDPSGRILTLRVHDGKFRIQVHEAVLCQSAAFLKDTVKSEWTSPREKPNEIDLTGEHIRVVKLYVSWLYRHYKPKPLRYLGTDSNSTFETKKPYYRIMPRTFNDHPRVRKDDQRFAAELYVFREKILDEAFCDTVLKWSFVQRIDFFEDRSPENPLRGDAAAVFCEGAYENSYGQMFVRMEFKYNGDCYARYWPREVRVHMPAVFPMNRPKSVAEK